MVELRVHSKRLVTICPVFPVWNFGYTYCQSYSRRSRGDIHIYIYIYDDDDDDDDEINKRFGKGLRNPLASRR
jgi:hypothetical protein